MQRWMQVELAVKNMAATLTGMLCDGAKPSCALKVASGVSSAVLCSMLAMEDQGITTTPIQIAQAMTSLTNDGVLLKPYIVSKIVNPDTGEVILENKKNPGERVASSLTVKKMIQLMDDCVNGTGNTGLGFRIDSENL